MSFTIDETKIEELLSKSKPSYTVTGIHLDAVAIESEPPSSAVYGTSYGTIVTPMADVKNRLSSLRRKIVDSGTRLMTTAELDREVDERRRGGDR